MRAHGRAALVDSLTFLMGPTKRESPTLGALRPKGGLEALATLYVGEAMVLSFVKGTAFDNGQATVEPATVAEKFWALYKARGEVTAQIK